jgi:ADP-heptose:LPS heptosyltransferase
MRNHLRRICRALVLRAFAAAQVGFAWLCLPLALIWIRRNNQGNSPKQILAISLGAIGDHILVIPTLKALRSKYPHHLVTLVVRPMASGFQQMIPESVDREVTFPYENRFFARLMQPLQAMLLVVRHNLASATELAIIPRWEWDSWGAYFIAFFSRAPSRVTFSERVNPEKAAHNWLFDSLCTHVYSAPAEENESAKLAFLLAIHEHVTVGSLSGELCPQPLRRPQPRDGLHVVLAPIAGTARRNWPLENYRSLMEVLRSHYEGVRFSILGSTADESEIATLASGEADVTLLCGLHFQELIERIAGAALFIGADSGMAHLAGAAGLPVVQIFCHPKTAADSHYNSPARFTASSPHTAVIQPVANVGCEQSCESTVACCVKNVDLADVLSATFPLLPVHQER